MGNIRIIFVGTGVPDGPSKQKLFEKLLMSMHLSTNKALDGLFSKKDKAKSNKRKREDSAHA